MRPGDSGHFAVESLIVGYLGRGGNGCHFGFHVHEECHDPRNRDRRGFRFRLDHFRGSGGEDVFGGKRSKLALDAVKGDLHKRGIRIETGVSIKKREYSCTMVYGFVNTLDMW